ncbi:ThiF family adenylyltransferase [Sphingomonas sp. AR_OL41]|uniref:ThiF family adenylyltransferase n=1 Tax=Sphingomonas sp. AR_OL41 TaxID=3042729 RepID=UPI00247FD9DA|nr:ThiF family adenylyltransferase [Sphingomonas sp. AR_OL41]MDH7972515.1 ThiF family adenylyltransferase [Sphingomonas sp. AR_OL41]
MSAALISRSPDLRRLDEEGFELEIRAGFLLVHAVPYVKRDGTLARGVLVCPLTLDPSGETTVAPADHTVFFAGETPCHRDGSPLVSIINNSDHRDLGNEVQVDHYFSSKPEGTGRYESFYDKIVAYEGHLGRPARSHDATANARTGRKVVTTEDSGPFQYPDTASARYGVGAVSGKLALGRVAIIGLGGTGSYELDLVAKTPVREIHLYDDDQFLNHNVFRAPGAPESASMKGFPTKVGHFASIYSRMHRGIVPHPVRVTATNVDELAGFDFVFVCVDSGSARRAIAEGLHRLSVPFIDTGIGVGLDADKNELDGCARVTFVPPGCDWSVVERLLPFGDDDEDGEDDVYNKGIQIADLNALNATLAVLRWKRWAGFYRDARGEANSAYMVEGNMLSNRGS